MVRGSLNTPVPAMLIYTPPQPPQQLPLIDFSPAFSDDLRQRKALAWALHKACRETGFFLLRNHRVPSALIQAQFEYARRFFDLPLADKLALDMKRSPSTAGYEPMGGQILDSQDTQAAVAPPDLKESFYCGMELDDTHPLAQQRIRGFGHNQWPQLPGFRQQMLDYQAAMRALGDRVLAMLALSLELDEHYFRPMYDWPITTLRLIKYPPHPAQAAFNQLGAGAHTDWGGITLLAQDASGGLEVQNVAGEWLQAPALPEAFVVNLGDLMARWSNGLYNSNMHRVKNNLSGTDRYSVPFFYSPRPDARIECLPGCSSAERPPRYAACSASEHLNEMFRRSYGYKPA